MDFHQWQRDLHRNARHTPARLLGQQLACVTTADRAINALEVTVDDGDSVDIVKPRFELFSPQRTIVLPPPSLSAAGVRAHTGASPTSRRAGTTRSGRDRRCEQQPRRAEGGGIVRGGRGHSRCRRRLLRRIGPTQPRPRPSSNHALCCAAAGERARRLRGRGPGAIAGGVAAAAAATTRSPATHQLQGGAGKVRGGPAIDRVRPRTV